MHPASPVWVVPGVVPARLRWQVAGCSAARPARVTHVRNPLSLSVLHVKNVRTAAGSPARPLARPPARYRVDLGAHMSECDDNYERLVRLLPDLAVRDAWTLSMLTPVQAPVHLAVLERCPYTTTLRCSQPIGGSMAFVEPSLTVRMYHDARTAEVTEYQNEARFAAVYAYPNAHMRLPDEKVQINRLLGDLLMLCQPAADVEPVGADM